MKRVLLSILLKLAVQVLGSGVISAVHDGGDWKREWNMEFASERSSSSSFRHDQVLKIFNISETKIVVVKEWNVEPWMKDR